MAQLSLAEKCLIFTTVKYNFFVAAGTLNLEAQKPPLIGLCSVNTMTMRKITKLYLQEASYKRYKVDQLKCLFVTANTVNKYQS
jgi:hypothetical protein